MKFFTPVVVAVVAVVAFFSVQVDANGVCYDPDHTSGKSASTMQADMQAIAGAGFDSVRTYISLFGNTEMGPIIKDAGLTAVLGVPYPQSDYQEQMEAAIKAANNGGVYAIMVGNENLAGAGSVPSTMISVINEIKSRVSCKVGTVQRNTEVINYSSISGWSDLVSAVDVLGVNVHPFFNPDTTADGAIDVVDKQWQTMMGNFGDKLLLTETGWPSSGSVSGNTGSPSGEQTFYSAYQQWSSSLSEKFYFQFFDTPGKSTAYEQTFGLYTSDSQSKFTMSQQQQQTSAPTTQAPAPTTPAPTTAAPTPEPTTATPQPSTATPTPTPETYQSSGSSETNTTSSEASASGSDNSAQQGSASFTGSNNDVQVSSSSKGSSTEQDSKTSSSTEKTTQTTETAQSTATTNSIGKSSDAQQEQQTSSKNNDNTQEANTQSQSSGSSGVVGYAVGGGACAMLVAFGFIYQARKRAQELDDEDDKDHRFSVITPAENICAL